MKTFEEKLKKTKEKELEIYDQDSGNRAFIPQMVYKAHSCKHYWEYSGKVADGSLTASCRYRPNGRILPKGYKVRKGKIEKHK